jgi:hypothetical protein
MENADRKAIDDIQKYGCHIINVLESDIEPRFSYSIGIELTSHQPELVVTGLRSDLADFMINEYNHRVRAGETFEDGKISPGFLDGFNVQFKTVDKSNYKAYFGWNLWLHQGDSFRVLQAIWPTTTGIWPWDPDAPDDYICMQPLLYQAAR